MDINDAFFSDLKAQFDWYVNAQENPSPTVHPDMLMGSIIAICTLSFAVQRQEPLRACAEVTRQFIKMIDDGFDENMPDEIRDFIKHRLSRAFALFDRDASSVEIDLNRATQKIVESIPNDQREKARGEVTTIHSLADKAFDRALDEMPISSASSASRWLSYVGATFGEILARAKMGRQTSAQKVIEFHVSTFALRTLIELLAHNPAWDDAALLNEQVSSAVKAAKRSFSKHVDETRERLR